MDEALHLRPAADPDPAAIERLRRESRRLRWAWLATLCCAAAGGWLWVHLTSPENAGWIWPQAVGLASVPGKYVIFSGLKGGSPLGPWELALVGVVADAVVALTLAVGLTPLMRIPFLGSGLKRVHDAAAETLREYPRLKRMAFWGVALFIYLPLPASGAIGGTFVGQILGLSRTMGLFAVLLAGGLICITFASLSQVLGSQAEALLTNPLVTVGAALLFTLLVWLGWLRMRHLLRD